MRALVNATVFTGSEVLQDTAVLIEQGRIVDLVKTPPADCAVEDLKGGYLAPGFIDLQVNGGGGVLFNNTPTVDTIRTIAKAHRRFGTTGLLPTFITDTREKRQAAVAAVQEAMAQGIPGVLGIHLEGPHLSPSRRGVHQAQYMHTPDEADLALIEALPGQTLVTVAPETVSPTVIARLAKNGVQVSLGHTTADYATVLEALKHGATGFTHLFNAMSPFGHRELGAAGAALDDANSWCGIIVDGHHVHDAAIRLAWRTKPKGKLFLVTDAMPPVGAEQPEFSLYGDDIRVEDGRCIGPDGQLAGSALDMATAVRNCVQNIGIPLEEALRMASTYPAEFMGWGQVRGRIEPGHTADLVLLTPDIQVQQTWIAGQTASNFADSSSNLEMSDSLKSII